MRIEPPDKSIENKKKADAVKRKKDGKKSVSGSSAEDWVGFMDILGEIELDKAEEEAKKYLQFVLQSGNSFSRSPTHRNFQYYRDSIKKFLQFIEKGLYKIKEDMGMDIDYPKLYMVAEVVDERIHQIAGILMKNEKNTMQFAGRVEEINGLVLDLYR